VLGDPQLRRVYELAPPPPLLPEQGGLALALALAEVVCVAGWAQLRQLLGAQCTVCPSAAAALPTSPPPQPRRGLCGSLAGRARISRAHEVLRS
jgi:hypothetical protein